MSTVVVQYRTKPDRADENVRLVEQVFRELATDRPEGLRYATFRLPDGVSFVHVATVETVDGANPLGAVTAFGEFQRGIADRLTDGPVVSDVTVVGSYGFGSA